MWFCEENNERVIRVEYYLIFLDKLKLFYLCLIIFLLIVDDDDEGNEKKSNRSKKSVKQQLSVDPVDSTIDDLLSSKSASTITNDSHDLPSLTSYDPIAAIIPVKLYYFYLKFIFIFFLQQATYAPLSLNEMPATPNPLMNSMLLH